MKKNSLVLYKNQVAIIQEIDGDKFIISYCSQLATQTGKKAVYSQQKVREKDIIFLCENSSSSASSTSVTLENVLTFNDGKITSQILEVYELLNSDEITATSSMEFLELWKLIRGECKSLEVWAVYKTLCNNLYFAVSEAVKEEMRALTPANYIGRAF